MEEQKRTRRKAEPSIADVIRAAIEAENAFHRENCERRHGRINMELHDSTLHVLGILALAVEELNAG